MTKPIQIRINNISFECWEDGCFGQFLKFYKNPECGTLEEKYADGWKDGDGFITKGNHSIAKNLLDTKELKYVISYLEYKRNENEKGMHVYTCSLSTVGNRLLSLSKEDREDFFEVYALAEKKMVANNKSLDL